MFFLTNVFFSLCLEIFNFFKALNSVKKYYQKQLNNSTLNKDIVAKNSCLKILLLTPYSPLRYGGAGIRRYELVKFLGSRHHLVVVSFIFSDKEYSLTENLKDYCTLSVAVRKRNVSQHLPSNNSRLIMRFHDWKMKLILKKMSAMNFDVVLFDTVFTAYYNFLFPHSYKILQEHNIESQLLKQTLEIVSTQVKKHQLYCQKEFDLLKKYENDKWLEFPLRSVVSEVDKQELDSRCSEGKTIVVRNGMATHKITCVDNKISLKNILFMGEMSYHPNIDAVLYFSEYVLPIIWQQRPDFIFCIAGRNPGAEIYNLTKDARIKVTANPEDMSQIARECRMTVVPLRIGSGTRLKILHSMAMGLPVVSTTLGCEGLNVVDGLHILIRDQPEQFAEAVIRINLDSDLRSNLQTNAYQLVKNDYDWNKIFIEFEKELFLGLDRWKERQT